METENTPAQNEAQANAKKQYQSEAEKIADAAPFKLTFPVKWLQAILKATSTEETRYYLGGVAIQRGKGDASPSLIGTNGHYMAVYTLPMRDEHKETGTDDEGAEVVKTVPASAIGWTLEGELPDKAMIIRSSVIKLLSAYKSNTKAKRLCDFTQVEISNAGVTLSVGKPVMTIPGGEVFIDGTYPEWQRVIPTLHSRHKNAAPGCFNAKYLALLSSIATDIFGDSSRTSPVTIWQTQAENPAYILHNCPDLILVLMPMRDDLELKLKHLTKTAKAHGVKVDNSSGKVYPDFDVERLADVIILKLATETGISKGWILGEGIRQAKPEAGE